MSLTPIREEREEYEAVEDNINTILDKLAATTIEKDDELKI